ncbi:IS110 family transposase [uncultured Roseobacter sp.]|uniref:IS110 family transposase n=1 Tax=uncultured Roseobacter sp. TaxID=114847 RepID=UPI00261B8758|nr:IS110 family transposase [uncultured Roseobacter sp.]
MKDTIGIDVSKDWLDAYCMVRAEHRRFANDGKGLRALHRWVETSTASLVVFEASGVYHRRLENSLSGEAVPYAKVNPRQARRFVEATGKIAKTDKVDAAILAKMGAVLELEPQAPKAEYLNSLREMMTARRGLIKDRVTVRTRMQTTTQKLLKRHLKERLVQVEQHLKQIDQAILDLVSQDDDLTARFDILKSIPGISKVTAFSMLIEMPELGEMRGKQAACLAGLAPISRQSGKWQGKERIQGGRASFRRAMYMPALCVIRHNLSAKRKYDQLVKSGKPPKVALTAIMRKLVVIANALLRDNRKWSENHT